MNRSEFNFKKHQNFSKSWKTLIRFLIYTIVIAVILFLIFYTNNSIDQSVNEKDIEQIDFEIENIEVE